MPSNNTPLIIENDKTKVYSLFYVEYKQMIQVYIANEDHYINKLPAPERMIANMNKKFGFSSVTIPATCCSNEQKTELTNALKKRITLK